MRQQFGGIIPTVGSTTSIVASDLPRVLEEALKQYPVDLVPIDLNRRRLARHLAYIVNSAYALPRVDPFCKTRKIGRHVIRRCVTGWLQQQQGKQPQPAYAALAQIMEGTEMPWTAKDATRHTKKANTPEKKRQWAHVANAALKSGDSEASAIRQANAAVGGK